MVRDRQTDRQTDIATYRAAIAAKKGSADSYITSIIWRMVEQIGSDINAALWLVSQGQVWQYTTDILFL